MSQTNETQAVVIGAGIVGVCAALALRQAGLAVTLVDPDEPGGEQAASYGNGAFITPASIIPMSVPGLWRKVPGYLLDRDGPLTIRWRHLPLADAATPRRKEDRSHGAARRVKQREEYDFVETQLSRMSCRNISMELQTLIFSPPHDTFRSVALTASEAASRQVHDTICWYQIELVSHIVD